MSITSHVVPSPLGPLTLFADAAQIISLDWGKGTVIEGPDTELLLNAGQQLKDYFSGDRKTFDLPLDPHGTDFQKAVWQEMLQIPYGKTKTYGEVAAKLKSAPRAVGGACGANPIPLIIPCHRILGTNGSLGGYSGGNGQETKQMLLRHEGALSNKS